MRRPIIPCRECQVMQVCFQNAYEVAKLAQVIINEGGYDDIKFFDKTTLDNFYKT